MTAQCQACTAPSADAFLCRACTKTLRQMLADAPWWIDRLAEAAVGDTKMSDATGHGYRTRYAINGEHNVAHYLACFPGNVDELPDDQALNRRHAAARREALAAGGVNERASDLMDAIGNTLTTIVRDLCESSGLPLQNLRAYPLSFIGALQVGAIRCQYHGKLQFAAQWLSEHVSAIAADEGAGQTFAEIYHLIGDERRDGRIGKAVNRPVPMRFLGKCPTWVEDARQVCGVELWCSQDAAEVFCRKCRRSHNPDRLQLLMVNDAEREKVTVERILELNRTLPEEYRIPERTLRHWRKTGPNGEPPKLRARGYLRPDGRAVITRHSDDDEPLYLWSDVRKLRAEQWKVSAG